MQKTHDRTLYFAICASQADQLFLNWYFISMNNTAISRAIFKTLVTVLVTYETNMQNFEFALCV